MSSNPTTTNPIEKIIPAKISWQTDARGNTIPKSDIFNDVYYSIEDGLNESRYVFIEHNYLDERFRRLLNPNQNANSDRNTSFDHNTSSDPNQDNACNGTTLNNNFTILELGFGTGLNVLLTWQLWQTIKNREHINNTQARPYPHLHIISTEKHPLSHADLKRSLLPWQQQDNSLTPFIEQLLALYPSLVAGCHRLHLAADVTLDLWLGDALTSLTALDASIDAYANEAYIDAWYLDGFAPSCNDALWTTQIFNHMHRLSKIGSTAATFSCAGVVKRGLSEAGFDIKKVKGFGQKKHMLTAKLAVKNSVASKRASSIDKGTNVNQTLPLPHTYHHVAIVGAGVSGLMAAWTFAKRGTKVTLFDKVAPLFGASGNPRALLAPKMTPIAHVSEHLHTISYLYSSRFYQQLDKECQLSSPVFEPTTTLDLLLKANVNTAQINDYPESVASVLTSQAAAELTGLNEQLVKDNLYLPQAGLVNPQAVADTILSHPNITFQCAEVTAITPAYSPKKEVVLTFNDEQGEQNKKNNPAHADAVIIAAAFNSQSLDSRIFECRKIRGQLSWFEPSATQLKALPKIPLKYGGYCTLFDPKQNDAKLNSVTPHTPTFLLGASFVRNDLSLKIRQEEHAVSLHKLIAAIPELEEVMTLDNEFISWNARVGIRAQTPDYHPMVGQVDQKGLIWTLSGMGSKGFAFAPLCAQALVDMMMRRFTPLSNTLLNRLSPHRKSLKTPLS